MTTASTPSPVLFAGWARTPRGRWHCLVHRRATRDEALEKLREVTASERFVDLCVLPCGKTPNREGGSL